MATKIGQAYRRVRLNTEFSHRSRLVDHANFKSHEWKSLLLSSFPVMAEASQELRGGQIGRIWTTFAFLIKIYMGPEKLMIDVGEERLQELHESLYDMYEEDFGQGACSFNWHNFSHMIVNRKHGRSNEISTDPFESAYGMIQNSYSPGTPGKGKQILERMLMRSLKGVHHNCKNTLNMATYNRENRNDDSILTDDEWNFYKVREVYRDQVKVVKIKTVPWFSQFDGTLPFSMVGVKRYDGYSDMEEIYPKNYFTGKAVMFEKYLLMGIYWDALFS